MFSSQMLKDKVALVTGGSRGIGKEIVLALAHAGAEVVGTATTETGAAGITQLLQTAGLKGEGKVLNVTLPLSIEEVVSSVKAKHGKIDILVNNAAITQDNLFLRMKEEEWSQVIETNLSALYRLAKACVRDMLKARSGRIINIGSVVGSIGNAGQVNYAAAKAGVIGFTKALALEIGSRNITVNTVSPGFIETDMTKVLSEDQREMIFQKIPMQRLGTTADIAAAVVFLASEAAGYITGQTLHVNGGMYMN